MKPVKGGSNPRCSRTFRKQIPNKWAPWSIQCISETVQVQLGGRENLGTIRPPVLDLIDPTIQFTRFCSKNPTAQECIFRKPLSEWQPNVIGLLSKFLGVLTSHFATVCNLTPLEMPRRIRNTIQTAKVAHVRRPSYTDCFFLNPCWETSPASQT